MRKQPQIKKQTKNYQTFDKLWVKLNTKNNQNYQQSTQKSSKITFKTDLKPISSNRLKAEQQNNNIHQFLEEVHNKVKDSINDSQSQILQKMSIDWPEEENSKSHKKMQSQEILFFQTVSISNQGSKTQRTFNDEVSLKQLKSISELQMLLAKVNPTIYSQIQGLLYENIKLTEECNALKYNQKKITIKNRMLQNQVDVLDKKNAQLSKQNEKLKNRIEQISQQSQMSDLNKNFQNQEQKVEITESIIIKNQQKQSRKQNQGQNQKNNNKQFKTLSLQLQKPQRKFLRKGENLNKSTLLSPHHYNCIISEIFPRKK